MNRNKRYSSSHRTFLDNISTLIKSKGEMTLVAPDIAQLMGRTTCAIRKQIELRKGWYYR